LVLALLVLLVQPLLPLRAPLQLPLPYIQFVLLATVHMLLVEPQSESGPTGQLRSALMAQWLATVAMPLWRVWTWPQVTCHVQMPRMCTLTPRCQ
jgi:hypothetical protein